MAIVVERNQDFDRGRWIPWVFVAFFGVVLVANVTLLVAALHTWTGLETTDAYERGLAYNRALAAAAEREALGWQVTFAFTREGDRRGVIEVGIEDRFGNFLQKAEVTARFVRPTQEGYDRTVTLEHQYGARYSAEVELPLAGQWEVRLSAAERGQQYQLSRRIFVEP
jgi:nitrogen fixation protein FixH